MLGRDLAYVALAVRDLDSTAEVLGRHLGLTLSQIDSGRGDRLTVAAVGESALLLCPLGHPVIEGETRPGVHHVALGFAELHEGLQQAKAAGIEAAALREASGPGGACFFLPESQTASVLTCLTGRIDIARRASANIERLDHLGVASADNRAAIAAWHDRMGSPIESQQTDMEVMIPVESFTSDRHGVIYHTRPPVPVGGLRVAFLTVGDTDLEFLQNFDPRQTGAVDHGTAGNTRQDQGAIAKYVASRGPGLHHIAFKTPDIDAVLTRLDRAGVPMIDTKGRPGSRAGLIGFIHPKGTGGVLMHFDERPG